MDEQDQEDQPVKAKDPAAVELGRRGGKKGGRARAAKLSPERRKEIARTAAVARWGYKTSDADVPDVPDVPKPPDVDSGLPVSPFAKFRGELELGGTAIDCYVLDTSQRVISTRAATSAVTGLDAGNLVDYLDRKALKPFTTGKLELVETIAFNIPGTGFQAKGITAERFLDICNVYVEALQAGALTTARQREIAVNCAILLSSCAKVGLIALIDEATGYQYERQDDALQIKLRAFITEELRAWEKTFPDELWEEFGRLTKWTGALHKRPRWWGKLVMELIYSALDPDIAEHLKTTKPPPRKGQNYHQWLTSDIGLRTLLSQIHQVIGIAKTCKSMRELRDKVAEHYGREPVQVTMYLPKSGDGKES